MQRFIRYGNAVGSLFVVPHRRVGPAIYFWGLIALVSMSCALWVADAHSDAYWEIRQWLEIWRTGGTDIYPLRVLGVDYPPHAIIILWPLLGIPRSVAGDTYAILNVFMCGVSTWLLVSVMSRLMTVSLTRLERTTYVLMLLAWSSVRVSIWSGQTTPLVLLLLCLSLRMADRFPIAAGIVLGLGTLKPHVAMGFLLVFWLQKRFSSLIAATLTIGVLFCAYCASVGRSVPFVLGEYYHLLVGIYGGSLFLRGEVDIRPFFIDVIRDYSVGESLFLATAAVTGALVIWFSWRVRSRENAMALILSTAVLWSLEVFPFRRYGLTLVAPFVLYLLWDPHVSRRTLQALGVVVFSIVIDVPFLVRHAIEWSGWASGRAIEPWFHYTNRFAILGFFVAALLRLKNFRQVPPAPAPAIL